MPPIKTRQKEGPRNTKTNTLAITIIAIVILSFSAVLFLLLGKMLVPEKKVVFDQTNKTFVVKGDVKVKKAKESSAWQDMDTSTVLEKGDVIQTSKDSSVDVVIGSDTDKSIRVGENSSVEVSSINPAELNLSKGKIMVAIKKLEPKSSFTIKTPTAICGARGTAWSEETDGDKTKVCVFENKIYASELDSKGKPKFRKYTIDEGTQRVLTKGKPIGESQNIGEADTQSWEEWSKGVKFLRDGKILINDFDKKENFNNLGGAFGSWVVFYSDLNQHCRDEFSASERTGDKGFGLKLDYDVDSPYSAYNGFFTKLMGIDLTGYKYLVFSIKGDKNAGFTTRINLELKNKFQIGRIEVKGITDEWQRIVLPLGKFAGILSFGNMKEFVIVFSDLNATKKAGVVYIDDIYFTKTEPTG